MSALVMRQLELRHSKLALKVQGTLLKRRSACVCLLIIFMMAAWVMAESNRVTRLTHLARLLRLLYKIAWTHT